MSRLAIAAVLGGALLAPAVTQAQRTINIETQVSGVAEGIFYLGTAPIGSTSVELFGVASLSEGNEGANFLRDQMVPVEGIPGVAKRAFKGFRVFHFDDIQFWGSQDGTNWELMEPRVGFTVTPAGGGSSTITFFDVGSNGLETTTTPLIPAVGNIGLGILIASLIAAGGWVISRRTGFGQASIGANT